MKTILWATLTANGNYAQSSPENLPKEETLDDFVAQARAVGNFIVGRRTFETTQVGSRAVFPGMDIVVVSQNVKEVPGGKFVSSPQEALNYLQAKGHTTALLVGGGELHNAFLGQGLIDELIFNIAPVLEGKGLNILLDKDHYQYEEVRLLDFKPLGSGIVQLRYAIDRK